MKEAVGVNTAAARVHWNIPDNSSLSAQRKEGKSQKIIAVVVIYIP